MSLRPNDVVCIFRFARTPFILRFQPGVVEAELIGPAYVHEAMFLEKLPLEGRGKDEIFTLR